MKKLVKNKNGAQAMLALLVGIMITMGSLAITPAVLASSSDQDDIRVSTTFDLIPASSVNVTQSTPPTTTPSEVVMSLRIEIFNGDVGPDTFNELRVTYNGTNVLDVAAAELLRDDGDGTFTEGADVSMGFDGTPVGNVFEWTALGENIVVSPPTSYYWIRFQLFQATVGNTVDAFVDVGDIVLANSGTTGVALDPGGASTVGADLYTPHVIFGYVKDTAFNPLAGVTVTVTNNVTLEFLNDVTDVLGRYDVDIAGFPSGYSNGDQIDVTIPNPGYNNTDANTSGLPAQQVDVIVDATVPATVLSIGPAFNNTGAWYVNFVWNDPQVNGYSSGVYMVDIYVETPLTPGVFNFWQGQMETWINGSLVYNPGDGEGIYYFYSVATDYAMNVEPKAAASEDSVNYDTTAPTATATGPTTSSTQAFTVNYSFNDPGAAPSGVANASLWWSYDGGSTWAEWGDDAATGSFNVDVSTLNGDGTYDWYTAAWDNAQNSEPYPPTAPADVEYSTLVDSVDPLIGVTTANPLFINAQGTFGGTPPPVTIWTNVTDANILTSAIGIRNEDLPALNDTYYVTYNFTTTAGTWDWNGQWYFIGAGELVTASFSNVYGTDVIIAGELNGANNTGDVIGKTVSSHYATYNGFVWSFYFTNMTIDMSDDVLVFPGGPDAFKPYRYDGELGYIVGNSYANPPTMLLNSYPIVDGRYDVVVAAMDDLGNTAWTNATDGNPTVTVDNIQPTLTTEYILTTDLNSNTFIDTGDTITIWVNVTDVNENAATVPVIDVDENGFPNQGVTTGPTYGGAGVWTSTYTVQAGDFNTSNIDVDFRDLANNQIIALDNATYDIYGTFNLNLVVGWNLITIPVLNPIVGGLPLVSAYNLTQLGSPMVSKWDAAGQRYINFIAGFHLPGDPQNFAIVPDEAYWVWMPIVSVIAIDGELPHQRNVNLVAGWNMVGYMDPVNVGDVETDWAWQVTSGAYDDIAYYGGGTFTHYIFAGTAMTLDPGRGYMVWSDGPATLVYGS